MMNLLKVIGITDKKEKETKIKNMINTISVLGSVKNINTLMCQIGKNIK